MMTSEDELKKRQQELGEYVDTHQKQWSPLEITNKKYYSGRKGYVNIRNIIQKESLDKTTRIRIINFLKDYIINNLIFEACSEEYETEVYTCNETNVCKYILYDIFSYKYDEITPVFKEVMKILDKFISTQSYDQIFSLLEAIADVSNNDFDKEINQIFENESVGYRMVDGIITDIISEQEIETIEKAVNYLGEYEAPSNHLKKALDFLYSDNPDYENSIKESISAIESICQIIVGEPSAGNITTLGRALNIMKDKMGLNPALSAGFSSIYGYTSNANGVRHANAFYGQTITFEDAKFMLVTCSAFLNYLISFNEKFQSSEAK